MIDLGKVVRWCEGEILWAENDFIRMCYVETSDPTKVGTEGWYGPQQIWVEFIDHKTASLWNTP